MAIKIAKRFFNQNYTIFHSHYHHLLPPTKRAVKTVLVSGSTVIASVLWNSLYFT